MSGSNKISQERNQRLLLELVQIPGNGKLGNICADCKARSPRWASYNLGIFICMNCASIHRKIGTHITKVKSLTMDAWSKEQVEHMKEMGNRKSNAIFCPNEIRHPPPPNLEDSERDSEIEQYIRSKYEYKRFLDKSALVASKLGPSRSASSAIPRSASTPLKNATLTPNTRETTVPKPSLPASSPTTLQSRPPIMQQRSFSQPVPSEVSQPQSAPGNNGGVWNDLITLQASSNPTNSTLPLQYQQQQSPPQLNFNGLSSQGLNSASYGQMSYSPGITGGYQMGMTPTGMSGNPYQTQMAPFTPQSAFGTSMVMGTQFNTGAPISQQSFGQQMFHNQIQTQTPSSATGTPQAQFFQPQPQSALQIQVPQSQGFLTPSPSQSFMSAPAGQSQFMSSSPGGQHFMTASPGLQYPGQQFMSHSPQLQMHPTPSPQPMGMSGNGMMSMSNGPQQQMMGGPVQGQFSSSPMMQMQQGQFYPGQQQQQQFDGQFQAQGYSMGGYQPQNQGQWGTM